ncbi:hypothetical protein DKX38_018959 [Salix brachista]|uniref:Uncharacterized protein n=1 Tax=Salix brachista TaxID=2182728 RepID=A0A5N5KPH9_9ROSI|nr:hypothetical protein DKX38_018959 [Salix brachista]
MVPSGHLAASITQSPTAEKILKRAFWGLICSHKNSIDTDTFVDTHKSALSNQNIDGFLTYSDAAMLQIYGGNSNAPVMAYTIGDKGWYKFVFILSSTRLVVQFGVTRSTILSGH